MWFVYQPRRNEQQHAQNACTSAYKFGLTYVSTQNVYSSSYGRMCVCVFSVIICVHILRARYTEPCHLGYTLKCVPCSHTGDICTLSIRSHACDNLFKWFILHNHIYTVNQKTLRDTCLCEHVPGGRQLFDKSIDRKQNYPNPAHLPHLMLEPAVPNEK